MRRPHRPIELLLDIHLVLLDKRFHWSNGRCSIHHIILLLNFRISFLLSFALMLTYDLLLSSLHMTAVTHFIIRIVVNLRFMFNFVRLLRLVRGNHLLKKPLFSQLSLIILLLHTLWVELLTLLDYSVA